MSIPEPDWKKFRPLRDKALANLCDSILSEIAQTSADDALSSHERYLEVYSLVRDRDKELGQIFDGYSRSRALMQLAMIQSHGLLEPEEFKCFSESTREYLAGFKQ
jgi:hypothetical protein